MTKEIKPNSFDELISELYNIPIDTHKRYRSNFVYRGVDVSTWSLRTSLQRLEGQFQKVEGPLLRNFTKYSVDRELSSQSLLYRLAFAQHHGLPTRVLDWSTAPKVALHFAVGDESKYGEDGAIWAVDVDFVRGKLPANLRAYLDEHKAYVFSVDMIPSLEALDDLDRLGSNGDFALFFEPPSLDGRIVNQAAILSVMRDSTSSIEKYLELYPEALKKIIVRKELKWEIRDKLDQDQINERMLFPGEDGTARWLKRYYGPGPNGSASAFTHPMT